jgi:hypothetical protein
MTSNPSAPTSSTEDEKTPDRPPETPAAGEPVASGNRTMNLTVTPDGKLECTTDPKPEEPALDRAARYLLGPTAYCA